MASVSVDEVKGWLAQKQKVVLLDSESPDVWMSDAEGVRRLPPEKVGGLKSLPKDTSIVTYTSKPDRDTAVLTAGMLGQQGFTRVRALDGGASAWQRLGLAGTREHVYPSNW